MGRSPNAFKSPLIKIRADNGDNSVCDPFADGVFVQELATRNIMERARALHIDGVEFEGLLECAAPNPF